MKFTYVNGVTGFSEGDKSGLLGLFFAEPKGFFLGLDGLYILFNNKISWFLNLHFRCTSLENAEWIWCYTTIPAFL